MKKLAWRRVWPLVPLLIALVLELLPFGARLYMAEDGGASVLQTYSYFSLTPYGYANFGPFITACLTVISLALGLVYLFWPRVRGVLATLPLLATVTALLPISLGFRYLSPIGIVIAVLLFSARCLMVLSAKD